MHSYNGCLCVCLAQFIGVGVARGQAVLTGPLDVNAMQSSGRASFAASPCDIGSVSQVFDGKTSTLYRSASVNPARITVTFDAAQTFTEFRVFCLAGFNDWMIETADTQEDLDAQSGSYALAVDWTTTRGDEWSTVALPTPIAAAIARLTVHRLTGDDYVHITEWSIYAETVVDSIRVSPQNPTLLPGQSKQFTAFGETSSSGTIDITDVVTWSSTAPSVATIGDDGRAAAVSAGATMIGASLESLADETRLDVEDDPTDLNVTFIERTPRYDYDAAKNNPEPGDPVVFTAHVRNWGGTALASVQYRWELDGDPIASGTITNFTGAGSERTLSLPWSWEAGNHTIGFRVDPDGLIAEASESNNVVTDRVNAIIAGFWVEQSLYDYFHTYQRNLGIGSNSWEDWIQRQMATQNALYASAVYPTSPEGVLDRVRIDKIVIVPDGALPLNGGLATNNPDLSDKTVDLMWGVPSFLLDGDFFKNTTSAELGNVFYVDHGVIHELGHARYLIDSYGFDVHNTYDPNTGTGHNSVQIFEGGVPVAGSELMPFLAWNSVLYNNISGGIMTGPYGFAWSPYEAVALNLIAGHRAVCGNYNPPCNLGVFLNDLPASNHVRFVDDRGRALRGADIRIYQATAGPGWYGKTIDNTPDLFFTTDAEGYAHLPRNPFCSGSIEHYYGIANGVAVLRIEHTSGLWYRFLEATEFNMQYWAGNTQNGYYTVAIADAVGCVASDADCDGDADLADFLEFQACFNGPNRPPAQASGCGIFDNDRDDDVDLADFLIFQSCFNGPNRPPACE